MLFESFAQAKRQDNSGQLRTKMQLFKKTRLWAPV